MAVLEKSKKVYYCEEGGIMRKMVEEIPLKIIKKFDRSIFENISYSYGRFFDHEAAAEFLSDKNPYTITVIVDNLKWEYWKRKKYVKFSRRPRESKFREYLFKYFFEEFGDYGGNEKYREFLEKYKPIWEKTGKFKDVDECIIKKELESRYGEKILARFKNKRDLFRERYYLERERYYNLPEPLNHIDWRNPYDNIFVWSDPSFAKASAGEGKKFAERGGSGSSGAREINSIFIFALLKLNKIKPAPSYLFLYSEGNELFFIKKFESLCVPRYDIGSNYQLEHKEEKKLMEGGRFLEWGGWGKAEDIKWMNIT